MILLFGNAFQPKNLARLIRSQFVFNVGKLFSGQLIAAAIPILAAPILGRLYTPSEYGQLAVYMSLASMFGMISTWQYSLAIVVQSNDSEARALFAVSFWAAVITSLLSLLFVLLIFQFIHSQKTLSEVARWVFVIPATTFTAGVAMSMLSFANRMQDFTYMALVSIVSVSIATSVSLYLGFGNYNASGLIISFICGQFVTFLLFSARYFKLFGEVTSHSKATVFLTAKKHIDFPRFSLPAQFLRNFAMTIPNYTLAFLGATSMAGHLARAHSLLVMPINLVGNALAQVFQERATREKSNSGAVWTTYNRLFLSLLVLSPPAFIMLALAAPYIFVIYLGPQWSETGRVAQWLAPMMCLRMIAGPIWPTFAICDANSRDFLIALAQFLATLLFCGVFAVLDFTPIYQVISYAAVGVLVSGAHVIQTYNIAKRYKETKTNGN